MKPATIRRFDWFYLAWVALTVVDFVIRRDAYVEQVEAAGTGSGSVPVAAFVTGAFVFWVLVLLLLWYLVSRKASVVAKWVIVVLVLVGIFSARGVFQTALTPVNAVSLVGLLASVAAALSLFGRGASDWFAHTPPAAPPAD